ncbi:MAG TPA: hypothetical protein VFZ53_31170 [Polyangiaceae bacterium]
MDAGKWLCLEWEVAAADNTVRIWGDGVAKPDLTVSTTARESRARPGRRPIKSQVR